jgi:hypothetical protein
MEDRVKPEAPARNGTELELRVRRIHRRDLDRVWRFLKLVFRDVSRETVDDAAIFLARKLEVEQELLPPRRIRRRSTP